MKMTDRERRFCDAFMKSILSQKKTDFDFDEEEHKELDTCIGDKNILDSFRYMDYIVRGLGFNDLLSLELWGNQLFLEAYYRTLVAVQNLIEKPEKKKDKYAFFDDLQPLHPAMRIKKR